MPFNSPIFIDHNKTYKADTCTPLKNAAKEGLINFIGVKRGLYPGMELPENHLPGINSIGIWDITEPQDWGLDWHRNEGIELTFLENGTLPFEVTSNRKHLLEPNDLTITRPWQTHRVGVPNVGVSRLYWIILDVGVRRPHQEWKWPNWIILSDDDLQHLTHMMRKNEEPVWHTSTDILHCFHSIGKSLAQVIEGGSPSKLGIH
ncbi:MAG: AraC family transcriptional regulator, partial [Spirochaetales bacterium]